MKYDPLRIVLICDDSMVSPNRHPLDFLADADYEIFLWGNGNGVESELPHFRRNQIYICFDPLREDCDLKICADNVVPALLYSYHRDNFDAFLRHVSSRYAEKLSAATLYVYGCTVDEFIHDDNFPEAVENFMELVVKQEYRDGAPMSCGISPRHFERRRPCWYPFEWLTLDKDGNVLQCPYCRRVLTTFRGMDVLKNDPALLHCLAEQLLMDFDECPECRDCRYWIDGWLGDEAETVEYRPGRRATVLHNGHTCRIFRMEEK